MSDREEPIPTIENEIITKAINSHGLLFKKAIKDLLSNIPGLKIVGEEYPISYFEGGAIDLLIEFNCGRLKFFLPVECKRGYVANKRWVFFEEEDPPQSKFHYYFENKELRINFADSFTKLGIPVCLEGIEIDISKENPYKAGSLSSIYEIGNQVSKELLGFLKQELDERNKKASAGHDDYVIFPLLITNSTLLSCKLDSKLIDISSGNLRGDLALNPSPYLILSHPMPHIEQFGAKHLKVQSDEYIKPERRGNLEKEGIMVVHAESLASFFTILQRFNS